MKLVAFSGHVMEYHNEDIDTISFHKAREVCSAADCEETGIVPNATVMVISFKSGGMATFEARNWVIAEV